MEPKDQRENKPPQHLASFSEVVPNYNVFVFDLWGGVHDGNQAFPEAIAIEVLTYLKEKGNPVYLLSNTPCRKEESIRQLKQRGVPRDLYTDIFTAGEDCFECLRGDRSYPHYPAFGRNLYHIGADQNKHLYEGLDYTCVHNLEEANFILLTGTYAKNETIAEYLPLLEKANILNLPLICANPDKELIYNGKKTMCAGAIAEHYANMGGEVHYHGKPDVAIYQKLLDAIDDLDGVGGNRFSRVLVVGDSLTTDIKGTNNAHLDSIFILNGIHRCETPTQATRLYPNFDAHPTYTMDKVLL